MQPRVLFVSGSGRGNTLRYRVRYAEEALRSTGALTNTVHFTEPGLSSWAREADAVVLYRTPATRRVLTLVQHLRTSRGIPVGYDVDDRVFLPEHVAMIPFLDDLGATRRDAFEAAVRSRGRVVPFVDAAGASTTPVADDLATLTSAHITVLPNGVSQSALEAARGVVRSTDPAKVRIGYFSGSATHDRDWAQVEPVVVNALRANRDIELWLVGPVAHSPLLRDVMDQVRFVDFVPWQQLPSLLASVDINIAPLDVTPFTEGKSAIKWLEAGLVGTPTLATATRPFQDAVVDGRDALLVHEPGQWADMLPRLVADASLRRAVGESARESALSRFGPQAQGERYRQWIDALIAGPRAEVDLGALRTLIAAQPRSLALGTGLQGYEFPVELRASSLPDPALAASLAAYRRVYSSQRKRAARIAAALRRRMRRVIR